MRAPNWLNPNQPSKVGNRVGMFILLLQWVSTNTNCQLEVNSDWFLGSSDLLVKWWEEIMIRI